MTFEEYEEKMKATRKRHNKELFAIAKEYALSNNKVTIGNIVVGTYDRIKVDKITIGMLSVGKPTCIYGGQCLKKNNDPLKRGARSSVWQPDIKEVIG